MKVIENLVFEYDSQHFVSRLNDATFLMDEGTAYGVVIFGVSFIDDRLVKAGEYFVVTSPATIKSFGLTAVFNRRDWRGRMICGGEIDKTCGDVKYIDGCTDSLLVAPHKLGDPCLNALYFPPNVSQTFHTHPSIRLGCVLYGSGTACIDSDAKQLPLQVGCVFGIGADEKHRFMTKDEGMVVIAYHPDSDWGPTDEEHPMINRTIL
jgi:hypothetical protein